MATPDRNYQLSPYQPQFGCVLLLLTVTLMCLMPFFLIEAAQIALAKLHLPPSVAILVLMGIFVGGLVNFPVQTLERREIQVVPRSAIHTLMGWVPVVEQRPTQTIIAVNLGGCVIPLGLAAFEVVLILTAEPRASIALGVAVLANIVVCYLVARPLEGIGIALPAFASPAVAVGAAWLLLMPEEYHMVRAPVAFVAGVLGPLIGADLLHFRQVMAISARVVSIGGAGTFDAIVLSGLLAAFLA